MAHHLIFEGAELVGKSSLMQELYDVLEPRYQKTTGLLDGCHWFNCDVGIFGTPEGRPVIEHYTNIIQTLRDRNLLLEKFHLSDLVYHELLHMETPDYHEIEQRLLTLDVRLIFCTMEESEALVEKRLQDRLRLYPHYQRIQRSPQEYLLQQRAYEQAVRRSILPTLTVDLTNMPPTSARDNILTWLNEPLPSLSSSSVRN
ncbi:MAG: hypothetical protein AAB733_03175 [Patescibacteria group bacterium]